MRSRSHFFCLPTTQFQIVTLTGESCVEQLHLFPWMRTGHGGKVFSLTPHPTYITFKSNHNIQYFLLVYMTMNTRVTKLKNCNPGGNKNKHGVTKIHLKFDFEDVYCLANFFSYSNRS